MGLRLRRMIGGAWLGLWAGTGFALAPLPPNGTVVDLAGVMDQSTILQLDSALATYATATGFELSVLTVDALPDETLQDYARRVLQARQAGDANAHTGVLLWSSSSHVAVAVSAPLAAYLSPGEIAQVLREHVLPAVTGGAVDNGLLQGIYGLMVAAGQPSDESAQPQEVVLVAGWGDEPAAAAPEAMAEIPMFTMTEETMSSRDLSGAVATLMSNLASAPGSALSALWASAGSQFAQAQQRLQAWGEDVNALASGDGARSEERVVAAVIGVGAILALLFLMFVSWRTSRSPGLVATVASVGIGLACWQFAGFLELAVVAALSGPLLWLLLLVLPRLFSRIDEERLPPTGPRTDFRMPSPRPSALPVAAAAARAPAASAQARAAPASASGGRELSPDFKAALERVHRAGIRTPALDHLMAQKGQLQAPGRKAQRRNWLIAVAVMFFIAFPLALVLLVVWAISELNHLKPRGQALPEFLRQLMADLKAVGQQRTH